MAKDYRPAFEKGRGVVRLFDYGPDCLLVFTAVLLELLDDRVTPVDHALYFSSYIPHSVEPLSRVELEFPLSRPPAGRKSIFALPGQ